jgi:hypothetical protein
MTTSHFGRLIEWTPDFISGNAPMAFTVTPNLKGDGRLAGTITFRFVFASRWGTLSSQSNIAGSAAMTFGGGAIPQATANLSGTSGLQLSVNAAPSQQTNIEGSVSVVFGASGLATGSGNLGGAIASRFSNVLDSSGNILGALRGSAVMSLSGSALPAASGSLSGSATSTFDAAAAYSLNIDIGGGASLSITSSGLLSASGDLIGLSPLLIGASAEFIPQSEILGISDSAFDALGTILGDAGVEGISSIGLSAIGDLVHVDIFPLVGSAQIAFAGSGEPSLIGILSGASTISVSSSLAPDFTNVPVETQEQTESFVLADQIEESFILVSDANQMTSYEVASRGFTTSTID